MCHNMDLWSFSYVMVSAFSTLFSTLKLIGFLKYPSVGQLFLAFSESKACFGKVICDLS